VETAEINLRHGKKIHLNIEPGTVVSGIAFGREFVKLRFAHPTARVCKRPTEDGHDVYTEPKP
jgi:hypothetical protein